MTPGAAPAAGATVPVWRPAVRLAHWTLALGVTGCLVLVDGGPLHERLGYAALGAAGWRVLAGFAGPRRDRFAAFVRGPGATLAYARALAAHREPRHLGHNPLGGWMIVALLAAALLAAGSGALYVTDRFWGDDAVYRWHRLGGWALAALLPLHLAGVAFTSRRQRENLARAMVTGRKRAPGPGDVG